MSLRSPVRWGALCVLVLAAAPAYAQVPSTDGGGDVPAAVARAVRATVAERWQVEPDQVVLEFGLAPHGWDPPDDATVRLTGSGSGGWWVAQVARRTGAEAGIRVRAGVEIPVLVAARTLSRGHELAADDLSVVTEVRWGAPADEAEATARVGWRTQRLVREGERLVAPAVKPPLAVRSGQAVEVLWRRGTVDVRAPAKAAGSAPMGGAVYVRTDSGRRLRGVVVAPGVVDVTSGGGER